MSKIAIIGAGLAGAACAYVLKSAGLTPVVYELAEKCAFGASGNDLGLYNPRFTAERSPESEYYAAGFGLALRTFKTLSNVDFTPCGALHLITNDSKATRFPKTMQNWGWAEDHMRIVAADEASEIAGVDIAHEALYLPGSGMVSPKKLCNAYLEGVEVRYGTKIDQISDLAEDIVILCNAMGAADLCSGADLPLKSVRGQVTHVKSSGALTNLKTALCYGGYTTPALGGAHMVGSTFQRWLDHSDILPEDDADNIAKLHEAVPAFDTEQKIVDHRAAVRTTSPDHFPIVGRVPDHDHVYISTAHGSHGILSSLTAAHLLADMILGRPKSLPIETIKKLDPARFHRA